ncbi:MAG: NUDIX domain-containing protein [Treponema sp.]|jgi:8-oxo-dGTP diphosphatase|nr:NUDIX domain-containing protein [Treponema sp.]
MAALGRSVAGIAIKDGKLFIARRISGGDLGEKWEFPGGKVEEGEADEEALIREYKEEFSAVIQTGPFLGSVFFEHRGVRRILNAYQVYFSPAACKLAEHTQWSWAAPEEIEQMDFANSDLLLLPQIKARLDSLQRDHPQEPAPEGMDPGSNALRK